MVVQNSLRRDEASGGDLTKGLKDATMTELGTMNRSHWLSIGHLYWWKLEPVELI